VLGLIGFGESDGDEEVVRDKVFLAEGVDVGFDWIDELMGTELDLRLIAGCFEVDGLVVVDFKVEEEDGCFGGFTHSTSSSRISSTFLVGFQTSSATAFGSKTSSPRSSNTVTISSIPSSAAFLTSFSTSEFGCKSP
jgi:hypothetical protein